MSAAATVAPVIGAPVLVRGGHIVAVEPLAGQRAIGITVTSPSTTRADLVTLELADAAFLRNQLNMALLIAALRA